MSAQSAKKKRIGSRRRVANQNEISKADEFHVGDSTSVAGSHIPEEHTESLNVLGHFDNSQSESQHPPSPELSGGRRKLGSSRRLKGRHVKDSVTESYHEAREEVEDKTREKETTVSKQTPLAIQPERQEASSQGSEHDDMSATPEYSSEIQKTTTTNYPEADLESLIPKGRNLPTDLDENENDSEVVSDSYKLAETTQEGNDISILHSEKVKESAHLVGISELTSLSALSCPTVDQQLIDQSNFKEMPEEKRPSVCSVTEKEGKERDDDTESFRHDGNLQGSYLVSESHVESAVMQFSTTPEITTEKISPTENTEVECSVGQATILSPKEELPTDEEQNEHFNLSEVRAAHHSEDDVNKQHEQEIRLTEKHMPPDDTENSEIISGNLTDQTEVSDTYQSELTEKSTDGSPSNQDISYPEDKQDEHPTDENNFEALEQKNEDYHVYDTKEPQISDIERVDSALGQVYEIEGRVEDDIKPSAEQTAHQEKEGLFSEVEESESSLQTVQSEINATLDSQPQQDDTSLNPIGNRRKLGSSRRNRGRQHVKDSAAESDHEHKEDAESTRGNEAIETAQMLLATERTSQEELSQGSEHDVIPETHDSSLYSATVTDYSSEVQSPTTTNYPEADLESLIPESENLQEDHDERETHFKVEVSDKSVGATLEGADKSDSLQGQEVKGEHHSEDAVNKEHEQEVKPTENQEMPQIDNSSESVIRDATENSEIISGNMTDQIEVSDTYQSELTEKGTDRSPTNQDISYPEDKQDEHPTDENNFEALEQKNEDYHVYDTKEPQISDIERVDSALGQVYEIEGRVEDDIKPSAEQTAHQEKEGLFSEVEESGSSLLTVQSEINAPLDSQPQQDDTSFNPIGNRRKLGSSRRNRGRRHVKDSVAESDHEPTEDVVGNTRDNEPLETTEMSLTMETAVQEKSMETMLEGMDTFDTPQTEDVSDQVKENAYVGTVVGIDLHSSTTVDQQMIDQSNFRDISDEELLNVSSVTEKENKERDEDTELFRQVGHLQTNYLVSEDIESSLTPEITTEQHSSREHTEPEYSVEQAIFSSPEEELQTNEEQNEIFKLPEVKGEHHSEDAVNKDHEQEVKPTENQEMPQIDNSSESVMHDATENSELISGNLTDQTEVSDIYQSELTEKSTDGSPTNQDISYPDDKQDEHPTKEVLYEIEGRVEDDIKPSAEQTAHPEKEGLFSEVEESGSSLLTVQSEINAPLDSQPQQDDTSFNPIGNRRKLGSSRRNRGRRHVKDSAAESDHEPTEDVVGNTRDNEPLEITEMSLTIETAVQEKSMETMLEGMDTFDTPQTEDVSDQVKENAYVGTVVGIDLHSSTTVDQQMIDQSNFRDIPDEELLNVSSVTEKENKERDEDTELFRQVGHLQTNYLVSEDIESSITPEITTEKHSSREHTEPEYSVEQAIFSSPEEELPTNEEQNEIFNLPEQEVKPTENQEMPQIDNSSESVMHDATENSELISGNLTDQTEVSDTYQSELTEKNTDGSPTNQDISCPEDKQDEHPTKEVVYEIEGRVEDDIKPSAEQTAHQEKEGLFSEVEESESSLLTVQSEINASLDSQPQQDDTSFNPIGNRRKLGSSRRNRGRRHVKDSAAESDHEPTEDVVGNTRDNEPLEITEMSLTIETAVQEKSMETMLEGMDTFDTPQTEDVSDQVKENAYVGTVVGIDLHSSTTVDQQMIDQSNFRDIPDEELLNVSSVTEKENKERDEDTELFRQVGHLQTNYLVSEDIESSITPEITTEKHSSREHTEPEYSVEQAIFSSPEEELPTNEEQNEIFNLPEQEVKPTENQEMPQIDNSSESVMHDATENSELISGNLTDQTEVSDTYQSELTEKNTDGSPTNQDISCPEDKQDEHPTKEVVYEIEGRVEDDIKPSAEQTAHQEKEGLFSEVEESESSLLTVQSEINASLDSQPQQNDTSFNPIGNRRKLGSSRRNRGRRHVKDSAAESDHEHKEDVESTRGNEAIETAQMLLATERMSQEELSQGSEHDVIPETHDISLYSATVTDYSSEVQSPTTTNYPEADLESLIPESENLQEDHDERETHFKVEVSDKSVGAMLEGSEKSDSLQSQEVKGEHHSEDAVNKEHEQEVKPTENQEMPQIDNSSESVIRDEVSDTYQSELTEKSTDGSPTNQDISYPEDKQDEHPTKEVLYEIEGRVEDDIKPSAEQTAHQEKEGLFSEVEKSESSLQTVQSEINAPLDSQPQQDDNSFNPIGNRRKLGSSRRNRGRQHVKDSAAESDYEHKEDVESTRGNEAIETAQMLLATERTSQEELSQGSEHDVIPETHDSSLYSATMTDYSSEVQSPTTTNYPEADLESLIPKSENLQEDHDERETHFKVEVSDKSVGATLEGSDKSDSLQSQEVKGQHHSEDAVNKEHEQEVKPTENQEMPQIDKSQPQQDDTSFNPIGNRRKLGSSRRNRGRRHVMDSAAESDHEPTEDVVGNTRDNEPLEITEMSLTIETAVQEKSMETMLEGMDTFDTPQTEDVSDQVKHVGTQERDEDTESVRRDENLQTNYLVSETQAKSEDIESSISPEVSSENSSPGEHTEIECSVEQAAFSSSKEELSTNEERTEHVSSGPRLSEDPVNELHEEAIKPTQMQEMPQIDNSSIKDSESSLQTTQSEHFDSQPLDNSESIKEQTNTGSSPKGNRRKLGSSRRQKGRLHVEDTTKMSLPMETMRQEELKEQTDLDFKFAGEIRSTVNNEGNTEKMLEEDTIVATDMTSSSGKDDFVKSNEEVNEEECKLIKDTENLSQLGCDTVKMDLIQSLDVSATAVNMQQTNDAPENVGDVTKQDYETEAESSMHVQVYGLDDGEQFEDTTKKDHEAHEINVSPEITHAERFSAAHDKTDTLAPFDIGLEENIQAQLAVDVSEESGISSQQGIQEQTNLDDGENLQGGSKQKRRKLGSTRRTQLNRKPEEKRVETKDLDAEADMRSLDKMEVVEELTMTVTAEVSQNENAKLSLSPVDKEQQETISKALLPEQSASHNEEVVNPVKFVHIADVRDSERNVEPSQIDDFTATEMHISDLLSANTEDSTSTGITDRGFVSSCETTQSTRGDEERPESVNITQDQSLKSAEVPVVADFEIVKAAVRGGAAEEYTNAQASKQEPDDADEGAHNKHLEMKNASPNLDSTNRKRKMGSSRRNLVSRTKREDLNQKQEVDDEATETETNVGDVKTVSFSGNVEDEPQLHTEHKDSEQREQSETVAYSHTDEENPVSHGQLVETENQLTPSYLPSTPSTSPKHDSMSESSPGGRRRKMGSHRKSHGHQNHENQTAGGDRKTDNERDVKSITDESAIKTTEEPSERPLGLDKISEVDQSDKKPSSNISTAKSEKTPEPGTPVQRPYAEIVLGQESQHKFSLGDSRGADLRANAFNVMMVGDSSVGKSSFMKRAQSGKFSLEIPASIGLDSCMWTVVVDGKPVVLQLWDTAGQERFHSITRQVFHKAHAFLLMYDITSSQSFSAVSYWANCIQEGASENVTILLAGNKCDHAERQVNTEKAEALAKEYNFEFMECSAATGENVVHCLETVARMLSQKVDTREEDLVLHKEPQQRKSGCC
ncbi:uncharacterized protein rab44 isoform X2 [Sebastes fasciatus]|uniref:uncharacterized protein rab44 isoform X2 n=1 Tax=Sebastes fasciatus TaxID=394691 RepID=UPI003D9E8538